MNSARKRVVVNVAARLHFGFLDLDGGLGRRFGSIGLAISGLHTQLSAAASSCFEVTGTDSRRAQHYVERLHDLLGLTGACHVHIAETIPSHAGLGSGTQLALALAAAVRRLHGLPLDVRGDAVRLGRGARSGIGVGLFQAGGLVIDGGRGAASGVAPVVCRMPFPEAWRVILVLDRRRTGVHGDDELAAFARLPPFPAADAAHVCRIVLMQALPALAETDLAPFAAAIKEIQRLLGEYFAPLQGGSAFSSPDVGAALGILEGEGAVGIGQSSWGPTGFAFAASQGEAERLVAVARQHPRCAGLEIRACQALNHGADITAEATATPYR